jgi:hypothetical protein
MADEGKGVALAILGIVAVIAVVGLVMLFSGASGQGVYGGEMRQGENPTREIGEEPARYVGSPPFQYVQPQYAHRDEWTGLQRNACPDPAYPQVFDDSYKGGRTDCVASTVVDYMWCCPLSGQAGRIATGEYEG